MKWNDISKLEPKVNVQVYPKDYTIPLEIVKIAYSQYKKEGHNQSLEEIIRRKGFGSKEIIYYLYMKIKDLELEIESLYDDIKSWRGT